MNKYLVVIIVIAFATAVQAQESIHWAERLSIGGTAEVEASYESQDESSTDIVLATLELGIDAEISDQLSASVLLLFEEDDTEPMDVDEAYATWQESGLYIRGGRLYVPFGAFPCAMISDPLTLEIGETRESAVIAGYANGTIELSAGVFNGDADEDGDDDQVGDWVASAVLTPMESMALGCSFISDMAESDTLEEMVNGAREAPELSDEAPDAPLPAPPVYDKAVPGLSAYAVWTAGPAALSAEIVSALDDFETGLIMDEAARPSAWNIEASMQVDERWSASARVEGTEDVPDEDFPSRQWGGRIGCAVTDDMTIAVEYLRGSFDAEGLDDRDLITAQWAVTF